MMKKLQLLSLSVLLSFSAVSFAQHAESAPISDLPAPVTTGTNALLDPVFNYNIESVIGANGNAGVIYFGNQFWVSAWASDLIHVLDNSGMYIETFTIPGLSGIRSFTTDGTSIYAGTASNQIFEINPTSRDIDNFINILPSTDAFARMVAYDPTLDGGNGGFWTGNFSSDIASFDMSGNELSVIPLGTHGTAVYGGAVDLATPGGPYLWSFSQGQAGGESMAVQLELPSGVPTGVVYDYNTSGQQPAGNTSIAGGLFISDEVVPGSVVMIGIGQGTPSDQLFGVLLTGSVGVGENLFSNFNLYPNPAKGTVNIETADAGEKLVVIYDILGKQVLNEVSTSGILDISKLTSGIYLLSVTQKNNTITKKLIVQ